MRITKQISNVIGPFKDQTFCFSIVECAIHEPNDVLCWYDGDHRLVSEGVVEDWEIGQYLGGN